MHHYSQEDFETEVHILRTELLEILDDMLLTEEDLEFPEYISTKEISANPRTFMLFADGMIVDEQTGMNINILTLEDSLT